MAEEARCSKPTQAEVDEIFQEFARAAAAVTAAGLALQDPLATELAVSDHLRDCRPYLNRQGDVA